nr:FCD domain-containing protein [Kineococcus aurantiacus]
MSGPDRETQTRELRELRQVLEPAAAQAAARNADDATRTRLRGLARELRAPGGLARADAELHDLLLRASGNATFAALGAVVGLAVADRAGVRPAAHDVRLHTALAGAVADGEAAAAGDLAREIVARTSAR